jgi:biopolymer transport protein ExbD
MSRKSLPPAAKPAFTSLVDIAFLVLIFFMSLPLRKLDGKLQAALPAEGPHVFERPPQLKVRISLRLRGDAVSYRLGEHRASTPRGLAHVLARLDHRDRYELHAEPGVPWKAVVAMVNELKRHEIGRVQFTGTKAPSTEVRRAMPLPAPR